GLMMTPCPAPSSSLTATAATNAGADSSNTQVAQASSVTTREPQTSKSALSRTGRRAHRCRAEGSLRGASLVIRLVPRRSWSHDGGNSCEVREAVTADVATGHGDEIRPDGRAISADTAGLRLATRALR